MGQDEPSIHAGHGRARSGRHDASRFAPARVLLAVASVFLLAGCGSFDSASGPAVVSPAILAAILEYFRSSRKWNFERSGTDVLRRRDRHRGFFVYRRAKTIGSGDDYEGWADEADQPQLRQRIAAELDQLEAYLDGILGTTTNRGPLGGGTDTGDPPHLDLDDLAKPTAATKPRVIRTNAKDNRAMRRARVATIVYRAAALHDGLWEPSSDGSSATLREEQMNELVDRRLRAVERMSLNVGRGAMKSRTWEPFRGATGPWVDGFRTRMFEYPRLKPATRFIGRIGEEQIADSGDLRFGTGKPWRYNHGRDTLEYNVGPHPGGYFPASVASDFVTGDDVIPLVPSNGRTAAEVIDDLFTPSPDLWGRTWLWCDHVMSAINLEALRFGLRRRYLTDDRFNQIVINNDPGYVALGPFVNLPPNYSPHLQASSGDPHFKNVRRADEFYKEDLEVGDQVVFWNSFVYTLITRGDWQLENAFIMEIDSDPVHGGIDLDRLALQGHGTIEATHDVYLAVEIVQHFDSAIKEAQRTIEKKLRTDPSARRIRWRGADDRLVRWSPYQESPDQEAWWVRIGLWDVPGQIWTSVEEAKAALKMTVVSEVPMANRGAGYVEVGDLHAVYFPLWVPKRGSWEDYLERRRVDPDVRMPKLTRTVATGDMLPGLFDRGENKPISVIKPWALNLMVDP